MGREQDMSKHVWRWLYQELYNKTYVIRLGAPCFYHEFNLLIALGMAVRRLG